MKNNSQINRSNNNNDNNNIANTSTNNNSSNEQNQTNVPSGVNSEMVVGTSLPQNNIISTTNTPPFSTTKPWGMPPVSNEINISPLSLYMPQSQNSIPLIMVSKGTNILLELEGNNYSHDVNQLRNIRVPIEDRMIGENNMVSTDVSNETLAVFRQQIDYSNH